MNRPVRILVVDDDPDLLDGTARILEKAGYAVDRASSGEETLQTILRQPADLVLLDRNLPDMDGTEVCHRIKQNQRLSGTFVVLISGVHTASGSQAEGLESGADGYISRPISNRELAAWIEAFARIVRLTRWSRELAEQLQEQNEAARQQGLASLNLMEDALAARDRAEQSMLALRDSELQFRSLVEGATDAIFVVAGDRFSYVNTAACRLFGARSPEQLLGQLVMDRYHPSAGDSIYARIHKVVEGKESLPVTENTWLRLDGHEIPVDMSAVPVRYHGEDAALVFGRDTTERRLRSRQQTLALKVLAELNRGNDISRLIEDILQLIKAGLDVDAVAIRLREGEDFPYREVAGFPASFVEAERNLCARDADGRIVRDQQGQAILECMCGVVIRGNDDSSKPFFTCGGSFWTNSTTELLGSTSERDRQADTRNRCYREGYESVALIPLRANAEVIGLLQINDHRPGLFAPETIEFLEGLSSSIGIALARRRAAEAQKQSEARARSLFEASTDAVFVIGPDGRYMEVNPIAAVRYGYSREELMTMGPADLAAPELKSQVPGYLTRARSDTTVFEWRHRSKDGGEISVEIAASPFVLDGQPSVLSVARDITERKKAQGEHDRLQAQLVQAQKMESVGRLAGGVAHDFNNLLTVINGYGDLVLRRLNAHDPIYEEIAEIRKAGERARELTKQLLVFSRRQIAELRILDLNLIVRDFEMMCRRVLGEDIDLTTKLHPELGKVKADAGHLTQVLMNLAVNARDAMSDGGRLVIETTNVEFHDGAANGCIEIDPGRYVQLAVSDTGVGMDEATQARLFEPFFTTKKVGEGTGLGLSTVYGIVKQAGGAIYVYSEPGCGTTFKIYLPRVEGSVAVVETRPAVETPEGNETILVVEDQAEVRTFAEVVLKSFGYKVLLAANASEALIEVERYAKPIHLLLTDIVMPGISGRELADRLRALRPELKVLYTSGYTEDIVIRRGILQAEVAYLPKPFGPEALARKIREVLGPRRSEGTILVVDDEAPVRGLLHRILEDAGYKVLEAENGKQAIKQIEGASVDLVITDLVMPEQEGLETIRMLRQGQGDIKIIAVSGAFQGQFLKAAKMMGADAGLAKPVGPDQLLSTVRRLLAG